MNNNVLFATLLYSCWLGCESFISTRWMSWRNFESNRILNIIYKTDRSVPLSNIINRKNLSHSYPVLLQTLRLIIERSDKKRLLEFLPLFLEKSNNSNSVDQTTSVKSREYYATFLLVDSLKSFKVYSKKNTRSLKQLNTFIADVRELSLSKNSIDTLQFFYELCLHNLTSLCSNSNIAKIKKSAYVNEDEFLLGMARACPWPNALKFFVYLMNQQSSDDSLTVLSSSRINALALILSVIKDRYIEIVAACHCSTTTPYPAQVNGSISQQVMNTIQTNIETPSQQSLVTYEIFNKTIWLLDTLIDTHSYTCCDNYYNTSLNDNRNLTYPKIDAISQYFNSELDHDDYFLILDYLNGSSLTRSKQLKNNSWKQLRKYKDEILYALTSTSLSSSLNFTTVTQVYDDFFIDLIVSYSLSSKTTQLNYSSTPQISTSASKLNSYVIFGDGDFSFTNALVKTIYQYQYNILQFNNISDTYNSNTVGTNVSCNIYPNIRLLSTSYDTRDTLISKYSGAYNNIESIKNSHFGDVLYSIDATSYRNKSLTNQYTTAIFNFPFADTNDLKINDSLAKTKNKLIMNNNTNFDTMYLYKGRHMNLLKGFFNTCSIHNFKHVVITLLLSQAVVWEIEKLSLETGYQLNHVIPLCKAYQSIYLNGYSRKRTYVDASFSDGDNDDHLSAWCFSFTKIL